MKPVKPKLFDSEDKEEQEATYKEQPPEEGWKGTDLTEDDLSDDDFAAQFPRHEPGEEK